MAKTNVTRKKSRSDAQSDAERVVVKKLGEDLGIDLKPQTINLQGCNVCVDGFAQSDSKSRIVLVESWARVGTAKPAQVKKVLSDVLKLHLAATMLSERFPGYTINKYMAFVNTEAMKVLTNKSWGAVAARTFGIKAVKVDVGQEFLAGIVAAQKDQDLYRED